jgi:hypothetical protein
LLALLTRYERPRYVHHTQKSASGITLTENAKERARRLALVSDFMAWKLSPGFIPASELHEPDAASAPHSDSLRLRDQLHTKQPEDAGCEAIKHVLRAEITTARPLG